MSNFRTNNVIKNFISLAIGQYGGMVCNMTFSIWLTRLLAPDDYGLIALSLFYFSFFNWLLEWGWEQGFMAQKEIPLERGAPTHLTIRTLLGIVPFVTFTVFSPIITYYISSRAFTVLCLLSLIYWLERVGLTYKTILERTYQLQKLATLEFSATIISYLCALTSALYGWGVYALVLQRFIEKGVVTIGYFLVSPWKYGGRFEVSIAREFFTSFGLPTWLGSIVSLFIYDGMPFIIRLFSDTHQVGLYAKAFSMATFPVMLTGIFSRLTTPLYTLHQHDVAACRKVFVRAQTIKLLLLVPGQVFMGVLAYSWIPLLLGPKWLSMIPIYQVMCVYGLFRAFFDDVPNVLTYGFKNPWALTKNQAFQSLIFMLCGTPLVFFYQALGGAIAMSIMISSATIVLWVVVCRQLSCDSRAFIHIARTLPSIANEKVRLWAKRY